MMLGYIAVSKHRPGAESKSQHTQHHRTGNRTERASGGTGRGRRSRSRRRAGRRGASRGASRGSAATAIILPLLVLLLTFLTIRPDDAAGDAGAGRPGGLHAAGSLLVGLESVLAAGGGVDDHGHAALAVGALAAVEPDGVGGVDHHAEHLLALAVFHREEARVDDVAVARAGAGERHARLVEARLHHRVVARVEVEVDRVADRGG